jgi:hypothetical protein
MATTNPITLSGFNGIDFNAIIQADSQPLTDLQTQQQNFQSKDNAFVSLAGWIGNMESTVGALPSPAVQTRSLPLSLA